ncbi:hypothetical protein BGZ76_009177 [Entomortierella beljakovae]|nr:hypothetical protein BGZ76_009177 [Entomortierella beljakovae]
MQHNQESFSSSDSSNDQWSKKRAMIDDDNDDGDDDDRNEHVVKKRSKSIELDSHDLFAWPGLRTSVVSCSTPHSKQGYFDHSLSPKYGPATPPLESAPFQSSTSFNHTQSKLSRDVRDIVYETGNNSNVTRGGYHVSDMGMETYYKEQINSHEGISIRSLSPAPSSPSGSINGTEGEENNELEWNSNRLHEDAVTTMSATVKKTGDKRFNFVMGYRSGCERCLRREKGHFAHLE